jgi:hypothetical protein
LRARTLPDTGWEVTVAAGSLGRPGDLSHAGDFFHGLDLVSIDCTPSAHPRKNEMPFPPSYEDKPGAPDRVFALINDNGYEQLVAGWTEALRRAGADTAQLPHRCSRGTRDARVQTRVVVAT